jgi:hypothetical protein
VFLDKDIPLTLEEYESIREELISLLSFEGASLEDRLIAGAVWLDILGDFIRIASPPPGGEWQKRQEAFDTFFSSMKNERYGRPLRIAQKSLHGMALKRMFLCLFISLRHDPSKRRSNPSMLFFIIRHYVKGYLYRGKIKMTPLKSDIPLCALRKIRIDPGSETWVKAIRDWGADFIRNDSLLKTENIQKGYLFFLLYYAIAKWYCIARAFLKKADHPDPEDILNSIRIVDEYYMSNPCLEETDASNPILKDILEGLFKRKSAPMILVRG